MKTPLPEARAQVLLQRVIELYAKNLAEQPVPRCWLREHGLGDLRLIESCRLGASDGNLAKLLPADGELAGELVSLGVVDIAGEELFRGCIVCPILDEAGRVETLAGWTMDEIPTSRHLPRRPPGLWNIPAVGTGDMYLVGSILDGLTIAAAGAENVVAVDGCIPAKIGESLREHGVRRVTLVTGDTAQARARAQRFSGKGFGVLALPGAASVNHFLLAHGPAELLRRLKEAPTGGPLDGAELLPDGFVMTMKQRRYEVRGLERSPRSLKATVRLCCGSRMHLDTLDLYCARARRQFLRDATLALDESAETILADLTRLLAAAEERALQLEARRPSALEVVPTDAERQEAEAFLRDPRIVDRILADFEAGGLVGERTNKLLCYLAVTSRKLSEPLAVLILASSGAGKTALQEAALAFCPPEDVVKLTSLSGKALFYKERASLRHKVLAVEEGEGLADAAYALRNLISAGELVAEATVRDPGTGRLVTMTNRVEGPTAVFLTTTSPETDPETKSRFIVTSMDESREQTLAVLARQRRRQGAEGLQMEAQRQAAVRRHWAVQRLLEPLAVVNPYASRLCFADDRPSSRRDQPKYLRLMAASALLRQRQKTVVRLGGPAARPYVEVDEEDVKLAGELATELLGHRLDELSRPGYELLLVLDRMRGERPEAFRFCRREVREYARWSHARVHRYLRELLELEYVTLERSEGRHLYRLRWDGRGQDGGKFLLGLNAPEAR